MGLEIGDWGWGIEIGDWDWRLGLGDLPSKDSFSHSSTGGAAK